MEYYQHDKGWNIVLGKTMDKTAQHYVKWNKSSTERQVLSVLYDRVWNSDLLEVKSTRPVTRGRRTKRTDVEIWSDSTEF